jgi:hypothetical protein
MYQECLKLILLMKDSAQLLICLGPQETLLAIREKIKNY